MVDVAQIIGSSAGAAAASSTRFAEDFDTFLILLTAQLQAQDPLDPVDSSDFTNQLVQFTGVEQSIQTNKNLENLTALTAFFGMQSAVNFIGKEVTVARSEGLLDSDREITWIYELQGTAFESEVQIIDDSGKVVREFPGQTDAGAHSFTWNGTDKSGQPLPVGNYTLKIDAQDSSGVIVPSQVLIRDKVQGVEMENGEALLTISGFRVPVSEVLAVSVPDEEPPQSASAPGG